MHVNKHIKQLDYPEYANHSFVRVEINLAQHRGRGSVYNYMLSQDKELIQAIAKLEHLKKENVLLTAGGDSGLHHISETFLDFGKTAIIPTPSFGRFEFHAKVVGARVVFVKHSKFPYSFDLKRIGKTARETKASVIFLANPNNPTGELIHKTRIEKFIRENDHCLIAIDEILIENKRDSVAELVNKYKHLVVVQSFSKLLGIPGLRIGYLLACPELIKVLGKVVSPYEVSSLSLVAVKNLILDSRYINTRIEEIKEARNLLKAKLKLPLTNTDASVGLINGGSGSSLYSYMLKHGILTVSIKNFSGIDEINVVRVIIDDKKKIRKLIKVIGSYKRE